MCKNDVKTLNTLRTALILRAEIGTCSTDPKLNQQLQAAGTHLADGKSRLEEHAHSCTFLALK